MKEYSVKQAIYPCTFTHPALFKYDISQLEICVLAALSKDPILIEELQDKVDIHRKNYSDFYKVPLSSVTAVQRKFAKSRSFELQYGASAKGMSLNSGVPIEECKTFIKEYFYKYKKVAEFYDMKEDEAYENAEKYKDIFIMEGAVPGYKGMYTSPMGRMFTFTPYHNKYGKSKFVGGMSRKLAYSFSVPQLRNYICQGTGYDIVNLIRNNFVERNYPDIILSNEIHDEEIGTFNTRLEVVDVLYAVQEALYRTKKELIQDYDWEIWEEVPLRAEVTIDRDAKTWQELIDSTLEYEVE